MPQGHCIARRSSEHPEMGVKTMEDRSRITRTSDGVLTDYGKKLERERLARLAAANQDKGREPSCE
jgi:hypothetical protein